MTGWQWFVIRLRMVYDFLLYGEEAFCRMYGIEDDS